MKKLKFNLKAFITLITIGLTIAAKAGVFMHTNFAPASAGDCYTNVPLLQFSTCEYLDAVNQTDPCNIAFLGDELRAMPSGVIPEAYIPSVCPGAPNFFCCAQLETGGNCEFQPELTINGITSKYRIKSVRCQQIQGY